MSKAQPTRKLETWWRSKLSTELRAQNAIILPQVPTKFSAPGVGDVLCIHNYWRGFIEAKIDNEQPRQEQLDMALRCAERSLPTAFVWFKSIGTWDKYNTMFDVAYWRKRFSDGKVEPSLFSSNANGLLAALQDRTLSK